MKAARAPAALRTCPVRLSGSRALPATTVPCACRPHSIPSRTQVGVASPRITILSLFLRVHPPLFGSLKEPVT